MEQSLVDRRWRILNKEERTPEDEDDFESVYGYRRSAEGQPWNLQIDVAHLTADRISELVISGKVRHGDFTNNGSYVVIK